MTTSNGPWKSPFVYFPGSIISSLYMNDGNLGTLSLSRQGSEPSFIFLIVLLVGLSVSN